MQPYSIFAHVKDTITAISSPPGMGAVALIRISGPKSVRIINKISKHGFKEKLRKVQLLELYDAEGAVIDEALVVFFKAPASYTGQNVVEITCHGSVYIQQAVLERIIELGGRLAEPGEFTQRAFASGKMHLGEAEAVMDLISAESASQHRLAISQMRGGFLKKLRDIRNRLIDLAALVELELDFSEEDVEFAEREKLLREIRSARSYISKLMESFRTGHALKKGIPVAIIGPPNVGKSTLLNALLEEDRAIITDIPGTTRDVIEDIRTVGGITFRFVDTAGIRETEDRIEAEGISRSKKAVDKARIVLLLYTEEVPGRVLEEMRSWKKEGQSWIKILNKIDLIDQPPKGGLAISARYEQNIDGVWKALLNEVDYRPEVAGEIVTNVRHYNALSKAAGGLDRAEEAIGNELGGEIIAFELRETLHAIGLISGEVTEDDILGAIFSRFCIGK